MLNVFYLLFLQLERKNGETAVSIKIYQAAHSAQIFFRNFSVLRFYFCHHRFAPDLAAVSIIIIINNDVFKVPISKKNSKTLFT